ncbi:hypothetical protein V757_01010 [Pelistega indica]|uniref:Uncharacterized protein n=1 Tax=Pelistega indica TaxID=1414851 RepID=V8GB91_9BURK|nr:hypothetical protein [Pelistega indica]ETD72988.1 hypothetical protein V757_01010 [Pelistega indica]
MKYADEVIELLSSYPHKTFRVKTIVNYINPKKRERRSTTRQVQRVLESLAEMGNIEVKVRDKLGGGAEYKWS